MSKKVSDSIVINLIVGLEMGDLGGGGGGLCPKPSQ